MADALFDALWIASDVTHFSADPIAEKILRAPW